MQLTWPRAKPPAADVRKKQRGDPFYLEPLSIQASSQLRARSSRSWPRKPRHFKFVGEKVSGQTRNSTELCKPRGRKRLVDSDDTQKQAFNITPQKPIDQFARTPSVDCSFDPFDQWSWSVDISRVELSRETNNDIPSTLEFIDPRHLIIWESPKSIQQGLFGKFEPLLHMCKSPVMLLI